MVNKLAMRVIFALICLSSMELFGDVASTGLVLDTKKIPIKGFPNAYNPTLIETTDGLLLAFRHLPLPMTFPSISNIVLVFLNDDFTLQTAPQILNTREYFTAVPSQSEDARLFYYKNELWIIYNDNTESLGCAPDQRRDMYIAKIHSKNGHFFLSCPLKLKHESKWFNTLWQKNWSPFEWEGNLMMTYMISPHEVLDVDFRTGICEPLFNTSFDHKWNFGQLRGGTPVTMLEDEYLGFFHSSKMIATPYSFGKLMYHYFIGAYTFSKSPPFEITKMSTIPIMCKEIYAESDFGKKVVFPGGFVIRGDKIHMALGKDDSEVWIMTLDKNKLMDTLEPVQALGE